MRAIDYRAKAQELRTIADLMTLASARVKVLELAAYYDRLAELAEKYEPDPWVPPSRRSTFSGTRV